MSKCSYLDTSGLGYKMWPMRPQDKAQKGRNLRLFSLLNLNNMEGTALILRRKCELRAFYASGN